MRASHIGLIGAAAAVVGYAMYALTPASEPESQRADEGAVRGSAEPEGDRRRARGGDPIARKFVRPLVGARMKLETAHEARSEPEEYVPPPPTPGQISPDDALSAFNAALDAMDEALEEGKPSRKRKRELYAQATNAFTALSTHLDGRDPQQRAVLEQAHHEMKERMKSLKLKVPKRPGAVLQPEDR